MTGEVCFVDCETTGLDPDRHEIWELAIIADGVEHVFHPEPNLFTADPMGLKVGRFYERTTGDWQWDHQRDPDVNQALKIARLLDGRHIVGAVPSFDAAFLTQHLRREGQAATWHYHLVDVEAIAAGYIAAKTEGEGLDGTRGTFSVARQDGTVNHIDGRPPWNSNDLSLAVGVNPDDFDRHTALGDAKWARAIYLAVTGRAG